jgi:hypothetical protein
MLTTAASGRTKGSSQDPEDMSNSHRRLQRILRSPELDKPNLSGGMSPFEPRRLSERAKEAALSPKIVNPASAADEEPLFQCTQCDMIVKETDPYCPFCGAIFADAPMAEDEAAEAEGRPMIHKPQIDRSVSREPFVRPEKFDIFEVIDRRSRCKDLLYREALKGFAGSARLLEDIERLISEIGSLGTDTSNARRLLCAAWEACRDGDWNLVSTLARQTEDSISPSIPDLVRSEIARAREHLLRAKTTGIDISPYVLMIKSAMHALHENEPDEALRITKELTDSLREDSVGWK